MPLNDLPTLINWPLFLFSTLIISLRYFAPNICLHCLEKYRSPTATIKVMKQEMNEIARELENISQQDQFALYTRKERRYNELKEQMKNERNQIETKQTQIVNSLRWMVNLLALLFMLFLALTGQRHRSVPLFNYPFFSFPFILWIFALNTSISLLTDLFRRYRPKTDNKKAS